MKSLFRLQFWKLLISQVVFIVSVFHPTSYQVNCMADWIAGMLIINS